MILKQKISTAEGIKNGWHYTGGITECAVYYDNEMKCLCVDLTKDKDCIIAIHSEAYLMNDDGKTIERICLGEPVVAKTEKT